MEKFEYRAYIKIRVLLGIAPVDIWKELNIAYPGQAPKYDCVAKWAKLFKEGRESIEDDPRSGRPRTAHTAENIELIRQLIEEDPHVTYDIIQAHSGLSRDTIQAILHDSLKLRKITSRWIPYELTDANRKERVDACRENLAMFTGGGWRLCDVVTGDESWFYLRQIGHKSQNASWLGEGESPRTIVRRQQFEPKTMFTIFFKTTGAVLISRLDKGDTINATNYINNSLKPLVQALNEQRPKSGLTHLKFHHDNAKAHTAQKTISYLERIGMKMIRHPPYSPDLAPCDFWLFDYIKRNLTDQPDEKSLQKAITTILSEIPKEEYTKTFEKWLERMQLCINNNGDYFEHLIKV